MHHKGWFFYFLKEGVIPMHILIGSGNVNRLSKAMIWEVKGDPCMPFFIWKVLHWIGGFKGEGSEHFKEIPIHWHGKNWRVWWGSGMSQRVTKSFSLSVKKDKFLGQRYLWGFRTAPCPRICVQPKLHHSKVVSYLGLPRLKRTCPYTMEGCKVTARVRVSFTCGKYYKEVWCNIIHMDSCHLS